jgi:hypothetical protein
MEGVRAADGYDVDVWIVYYFLDSSRSLSRGALGYFSREIAVNVHNTDNTQTIQHP